MIKKVLIIAATLCLSVISKHAYCNNNGASQIITMHSNHLPSPIGPYSVGKMIKGPDGSLTAWTSGQIGLDPKTGELVSDDVVAQAVQALTNLKNLAQDNGFDFSKHTLKNTVFLVDMNDFAKVNTVYAQFFEQEFPGRSAIVVATLPKGAKVEVESVFFNPNPSTSKACTE